MMDAGIVDPTKVTRSALENASSIASVLLTTEFPGGRQAPAPRARGSRWRPRHGRHVLINALNP